MVMETEMVSAMMEMVLGDDTLDGVESLLMEDECIPNDMVEPLYPGAVTICTEKPCMCRM